MKKKQLIGFALVLTAITIVGCDVVKVVRLTNLSNNTVELRTDLPSRIMLEQNAKGNYQVVQLYDHYSAELAIQRSIEGNIDLQIDTVSDNMIIRLQPNQYFDLAGRLSFTLTKIQPWELSHSRLSVYTAKDTIIAKNRDEIIELIYNPKTKYIKKTDKKTIELNTKYWKNIIIRE